MRVVAGGLVAIAIAVASACSPFSSAGTTDVGSSDAGTMQPGLDGAADLDAAVESDALADASCPASTCETFESNAWQATWVRGGTGPIDVTDGPATSGTRAVDVVFTSNTPAFLARSAGTSRRVVVSVSMLVLAAGDGVLDLVGVAENDQAGAHGLHLTSNGSAYQIEPPDSVASAIPEKFQSYTRVTLDVDLDTRRYAYSVGRESGSGMLAGTWTPTALYVTLGPSYATTVTQPWHVRFDDADVVTKPPP